MEVHIIIGVWFLVVTTMGMGIAFSDDRK